MSHHKEIILQTLRKAQSHWKYLLNDQQILGDDFYHAAITRARQQKEGARIDGQFIRSGIFKYPLEAEQFRRHLTEEIIHRVEPGPGENPFFLALLARQAASIEMYLHGDFSPAIIAKSNIDLRERVLIGTTPKPFVNAHSLSSYDYALVVVSSGMIHFLHQAAKAVILSWKPLPPAPGVSITLDYPKEDILLWLEGNSQPIDMIYETLTNYFFNGFPYNANIQSLDFHYRDPFDLLMFFSERFIIAHEYGHALYHSNVEIQDIPLITNNSWKEEFWADAFAFFTVIESAWHLDNIPPNIALQGPLFALTAIDLIRKAVDVVKTGAIQQDNGSFLHPPTNDRISLLEKIYKELYQVKGNIYTDVEGAQVPSKTLKLLEKQVLDRLLIEKSNADLHPIWNQGT